MVLTVRVRPSPGHPDRRPARRPCGPCPPLTVSAMPPFGAARIHEERDVIHKALILFALCIAGLAAVAAGFQHIPS